MLFIVLPHPSRRGQEAAPQDDDPVPSSLKTSPDFRTWQPVWLIRNDAGIANPILAAAVFLKFEAY
jgi:hypothetical protein